MGIVFARFQLRNIPPDTPRLSPERLGIRYCRVVEVYDGDTCTIAVAYSTGCCRPHHATLRVRMLDYDSPEMKPARKYGDGAMRDETFRQREAANAITERDRFAALTKDRILRIEYNTPVYDNFGRLLVRLAYPDGRTINNIMMENPQNIPFDKKADRVRIRDKL